MLTCLSHPPLLPLTVCSLSQLLSDALGEVQALEAENERLKSR